MAGFHVSRTAILVKDQVQPGIGRGEERSFLYRTKGRSYFFVLHLHGMFPHLYMLHKPYALIVLPNSFWM